MGEGDRDRGLLLLLPFPDCLFDLLLHDHLQFVKKKLIRRADRPPSVLDNQNSFLVTGKPIYRAIFLPSLAM